MEELFAPLMQWLESLATAINLEVFVVLGSFLEEIIAPIPSPFVMTTAAALAQNHHYNLAHLAVLVVIAAAAKTASSYVVYVAADKAEDVVVGKFGKYIGVSHSLIEKIGSFLTGTWWDDLLLLVSRALPLVPTVVVTVGAGVIKYPVRSFLVMTFLGSILRNIFYLWVGYVGLTQLENMWHQTKGNPIFIALLVVAVLAVVYMAWKVKEILFEKMIALKDKPKAKSAPKQVAE
jgi:membrane protein DedA with SNARE-associated domain